MNVYEGKQNVQIGQFQEFAIKLDDSIVFKFLDNAIIIQDINDQPQMKFIIDGGLLKYQLWDGFQYLPPQTVTSPAISPEDSTILPHTPSNTYISIDSNGFKVFFNSIERLLYLNQDFNIQMQNFNIDNELADFVMKVKTMLGQSIYIKDYDNNANILSISPNNVNIYGKQLKNLVDGTDSSDAATVQQLNSITPNIVQIKLPDTRIHLRNSLQQDIINIDNARMLSSAVFSYNAPKVMSNNNFLPCWQNILDYLIGFQAKSERNQVNGYAGLDSNGKLTIEIERNETLRLDAGQIKQYGAIPITTDQLTEGVVNKYYNDSLVLDVIQTQKGIPNGIASLDPNGLIPSSQLPPLQVGQVFSGLDVDKTNPLHYPLVTPIVGDRYISTDIGFQFILTDIPFTNSLNWLQLTTGGVDSVNGQTGVVLLSTDEIGEGVNKYFQTGITDYKLNNANQANELLRLGANALLDTQQIPNTLRLKQGATQLVDNQLDRIDIQNALNNNVIASFRNTQVVIDVPMRNNLIPIVDDNQFVDKEYVDNAILNIQPTGIATDSTEIQTYTDNIMTKVNNLLIRQDLEYQTTQNIPILYDPAVSVTQDQQLATKQYVDDLLSDFVQNSGVSKEFLQVASYISLNTNGKITGWVPNVVSQTQQRMQLTNQDTFSLIAGVYRFYIGIKIKEFITTGLVNITVLIRDAVSLQPYMNFDFTTIINADGGDQEFTLAQPYMWKMIDPATVEVYAQVADVQCNIYESYLTIEEVEKYGVELGRDRITDPTVSTIVKATNSYVNFNVNNVDYARMENNLLTLNPNIKVQYDPTTTITQNTDLVTKAYLDDRVSNSLISITDLGQMFQAVLSANQTTFLTANNQIRFDTQVLNTSQTITMDLLGNITFLPGFVYQVAASLSIQFSNPTGFAILSFKNQSTLVSITGSKMFLVTLPSSNTQLASIQFYMDLRAELTPQTYTLNIDGSLNLGTVYNQYTRITCEQKQIINQQYWDRIQNLGQHTQIKIFDQGVDLTIDDQLVEITQNVNSSVQRTLGIDEYNFVQASTPASNSIQSKTLNTNTNNTNLRDATIVASVNEEVLGYMSSTVTDFGSGNDRIVAFGGALSNSTQLIQDNKTIIDLQDSSIQYTINNNQVYVLGSSGNDSITTLSHQNGNFNINSVTDSAIIQQQVYLDTVDNTIQRESTINTSINGEVQSFMTSIIQPLISGGLKQSAFGAINADILGICSTNPLSPELLIYAPSQLQNVPVQFQVKAGCESSIVIDQDYQFATKKYVDDSIVLNPLPDLNDLTATNNVSISGFKIIDLGDATLATDALNRQTGDGRYYANTTTLNNITTPNASLSLNSQKITNLADATLATDALNRQTADSRYYLNTVTLDGILDPVNSVTFNNQKLTGLGDATLATDALNRQTADSRYYLNTVTLDGILDPVNSVTFNNQKITGLGDATLATDALNRQTADGRYYLNTITLDGILDPVNSVTFNNQKITGLGDATLATDALNRQTADSRFYSNTTTLNNITAPTGDVSLNSHKIVNLAAPTLTNDAVTKGYLDTNFLSQTTADTRYYLNTTTLNNILDPTGDVTFNNQKITGLGNATLATDALNRQTADGRYYLNTTTLNNILDPTGDVTFNNQKITGLGNATLATDALNRQTGDGRYYLNTTTLNNILDPTGDVTFNNQKITGLGDATLATDALNRQTADNRYYLNTTTLDGIVDPVADINLNTHKITGLGDATLSTDALNRQTADSRYYLNTTTLNNITAPTTSLSLNNHKITNLLNPTLAQDASTKDYVDTRTINTLGLQTTDYSTQNFKITNLGDATLATDALNRQTADTRYYSNTTTLDAILDPVADINLNTHKIIGLADATLATDALNRQTGDGRYYLNTTHLNDITAPNGNVSLNSHKIINLIDPTLSTDASTKNYVDTRSVNTISAQTADYSTQNFKITNLGNATLSTDALNRQTADGRYYLNTTTLNDITAPTGSLSLNSQKITNLANGTLSTDAVAFGQLTKIQSAITGSVAKVDCPNDNQIDFNIAGNQKLKLYVPSGQATNPCGLITSDKMQLTSTLGSFSFNTNMTQVAQPGFNTLGIYGLMDNDFTKNQNVQLMLQPLNSSGPQQSQALTITSGHIDAGAGMTNYSLIYNKAGDGIQQNLQISAGTPQTDNTINLYSNSYAASILQSLTCQFIGKTGYASAVTIDQSNQFTSKNYVDTRTINTLSSQTANYSAQNFKITSLGDATLATDALNRQSGDGRYYLNTTVLNSITAPTASLSLNSQKITNLANATLATDALNRQTGDGRYYLNTTVLNSITAPTGSLSLNSQKITTLANGTLPTDAVAFGQLSGYLPTTSTINNLSAQTANYSAQNFKITSLGDATLATDALNRQSADARYYQSTTVLNSITAPTASLSLNSQKITNLADATLATDALNRQTGDGRYYLSTTVLNSITAPTGSLSLNSQKITNLADATLATDALNRQSADARYYLSTTTLNNITLATASVNVNNNKIINLTTPTLSTDASTKGYVDGAVGSLAPIGSVIMWTAVAPPTNYLVCNGQSYDETIYTALFAILGVNTVPDLRGAFIRGYDPTATRDPDGASRAIKSVQTSNIGAHTHTIPAQTGVSGTISANTNTVNLDHTHSMYNAGATHSALLVTPNTGVGANNIDIGGGDGGSQQYDVKFSTYANNILNQNTQAMSANATHSHTVTGTFTADIPASTSGSTGIIETRPINLSLQYIIKII